MAERCLAARPVERQISSQFGYSFREFAFMTISPADVQTARRILAGAALRTPMLPSPKLSGLTGAEVFVKYENLQVTNSFKDRGAYVKLASLVTRIPVTVLNDDMEVRHLLPEPPLHRFDR
jgi:threonine synthase